MPISSKALSTAGAPDVSKSVSNESDLPVVAEACSVFAPGVEIVGIFYAPGPVFLEGSFKGELVAEHLTIGRSGDLSGKVQSTSVETYGNFAGEVSCQSFTGFESANVEGVVRCSSIELQKGISIKADIVTS